MKSDTIRKAELEKRRAELQAKLREVDLGLDPTGTKDWDDQAIEHADDEVLEGIGEAGVIEIRAIDAALQRLEEGEYGFCVVCGARIAEERLDVLPYTPFCRNHAR